MRKIIFFILCLFFTTCLSVQAQDYEQVVKEGYTAFRNQNFQLALEKFSYACSFVEISEQELSELTTLIETCRKKINPVVPVVQPNSQTPKFSVDPVFCNFFADGGYAEINVTGSKKDVTTILPDWCKVMAGSNQYLKIWCNPNSSSLSREGSLLVISGKDTLEVALSQEKGTQQVSSEYTEVLFRTFPGNARVHIPEIGVFEGITSIPYNIKRGKYNASFTRDGYYNLDTLLHIPDVDTVVISDIHLIPMFGTLRPEIKLNGETAGTPDIEFFISNSRWGRNYVDLSNLAGKRSYDMGNINYGQMYKDGTIPLIPGKYYITVAADGYETFHVDVDIVQGEALELECPLNLISGSVVIYGDETIEDARIIVDSLSVNARIGDTIKLPVGKHYIEVVKDGYILDKGGIIVNLKRDEVFTEKVTMTKVVKCLISADKPFSQVSIDGVPLKYTPGVYEGLLTEGETHFLVVSKKGFWTYKEFITVSDGDTLIDRRNIKLQPSDSLELSFDEEGLLLSLYEQNDYGTVKYIDYMLVSGKKLKLDVPKKKYKIKLERKNEKMPARKIAYKGKLDFTKERSEFHYQTWSLSNFVLLGFDYNLLNSFVGKYKGAPESYVAASAFFAQFRILRGLSSNILKATAIMMDNSELPELYEGDNQEVVFSFTPALLNYDFRLGGGFTKYSDVNLLLSYSYSPNLTSIMRFTHYNGHDCFAGIEVSSRIKYVNANLKMGVQYLDGSCNYYNLSSMYPSSDISKHYTRNKYERLSFVISAGISIGNRDSKGRNVLRVF